MAFRAEPPPLIDDIFDDDDLALRVDIFDDDVALLPAYEHTDGTEERVGGGERGEAGRGETACVSGGCGECGECGRARARARVRANHRHQDTRAGQVSPPHCPFFGPS